MSTVGLAIRWRESAENEAANLESWFKEFDQILEDRVIEEPFKVRQDADTWYFVNDADVNFRTDQDMNQGLDTWDF